MVVEIVDGDARDNNQFAVDLKKKLNVKYPPEATNIDGKAVPVSFTNKDNSTGAVHSDNIGRDLNDSFRAFGVDDIHERMAALKKKSG